jgi:anti-sigma factor RsiW
MNCSEFLARFSDFRDGELDPEDRSVFEAHLEVCGSCSSYERVVNRGVRLLRDIPPPRLRDDFGDRLRHTIYSLEDRERSRRHRPHGPSGGGAMAVVAAAVLVVAVLWTPTLFDETPSVDLPAIVVEPPVTVADGSTDVVRAQGWEGIQLRPSLVYDADLWTGANILLYEHSSLYQRSRDPELVRAGLH